MSDVPDDPYDLAGKNLRRVVPQVRRMIGVQRTRVTVHGVMFVACLVLGVLGLRSTLEVFKIAGFVCLLMSPFLLIGIFADHALLRWQQRRLQECERRLKSPDV